MVGRISLAGAQWELAMVCTTLTPESAATGGSFHPRKVCEFIHVFLVWFRIAVALSTLERTETIDRTSLVPYEDTDPHIAHAYSHEYLNARSRVGFFLCSANIRLDKFSGNTARLLVGIDNNKDFHTGLSVVIGSVRSYGQTCGHVIEPFENLYQI